MRRDSAGALSQPQIDELQNKLRCRIAENLGIDVERVRFGPLISDSGRVKRGRYGPTGDHWQIYYRGQWCQLPDHFEVGPIAVTWDLIHEIVDPEIEWQDEQVIFGDDWEPSIWLDHRD